MRWAAADVLKNLGDARALGALATALDDVDFRVRDSAEEALKRAAPQGTVDQLIPLLRHSKPQARQIAASELGKRTGLGVANALASALEDEDMHVRYAAASSLARLGDPRSPLLRLGSSDVHARVHAAKELALDDHSEGRDALLASLTNNQGPNERVEAAAAWKEFLQRYRQRSRSDTKDDTAVVCVRRLRESRRWTAVEPLIIALKHGSDSVRREAAHALSETADPRAVAALITSLSGDENRDVRAGVVWALGKMGDARATQALVMAAESGKAATATGDVVRILGRIGDATAVSFLMRLLGHTDDSWEALDALRQLLERSAANLPTNELRKLERLSGVMYHQPGDPLSDNWDRGRDIELDCGVVRHLAREELKRRGD